MFVCVQSGARNRNWEARSNFRIVSRMRKRRRSVKAFKSDSDNLGQTVCGHLTRPVDEAVQRKSVRWENVFHSDSHLESIRLFFVRLFVKFITILVNWFSIQKFWISSVYLTKKIPLTCLACIVTISKAFSRPLHDIAELPAKRQKHSKQSHNDKSISSRIVR